MSLTGASFKNARICWRQSKGHFDVALDIYEKRFFEGEFAVTPPFRIENEEESLLRPTMPRFFNAFKPGSNLMKGFLTIAALLVAIEVA